jgi:hypothetical protein
MGSACMICEHPQRREMERDYLTNRLNLTKLSKKYNTSYWSLRSHMQEHLPEQLVEAARTQEVQSSGQLIQELQGLVQSAQNQLSKAESKGNSRVALESIKTLKDLFQLLLQIQVKIQEMQQQEQQQRFDPDDEGQIERLHSRLNNSEREILFRLQMKMINNSSEVIIPEKVDITVERLESSKYTISERKPVTTDVNPVYSGDNNEVVADDSEMNERIRMSREALQKDKEFGRRWRRKLQRG